MAIFRSGNPTLTQKMFDKSMHIEANMQGTMSVRGAINKFGFLMIMVIAGAAYNWHMFEQGQNNMVTTLMITGIIGGLITALAISFKPNWAGYLQSNTRD
jgi:uncharacterized YccA/Bax inhibitor family protein